MTTKLSLSRRCLATTTVLLSSVSAAAQIDRDLALKSTLSVSAFRCSFYAREVAESKRLFDIGVSAGRSYAALAIQNRDALQRVQGKIPGPYLELKTPSPDFLVGRVYGIVQMEVSKEFASAKESEDYRRYQSYTEQNCVLLK